MESVLDNSTFRLPLPDIHHRPAIHNKMLPDKQKYLNIMFIFGSLSEFPQSMHGSFAWETFVD